MAMFADPNLLHILLSSAPSKPGNKSATPTAAESSPPFVSVELLRNLGLAVMLSLSMLLRTTFMELCYFASMRLSNNARAQLLIAVFRSGVRSASSASATMLGSEATGRLTNLMATDADSIGNSAALVWSFAQWTFSICVLPAVIYLMWTLLGTAAFAGAAAFIGSNVIASWLSQLQKPIVRRLQEFRDQRGELMSDLVKGIGVVKAYGCEAWWEERILEARAKELLQLRNLRYLDAAVSLTCGLLSQAAPVSIFACYVLVQGKALDANTAFSALAWIFQMSWSINALPSLFVQAGNLLPKLRRLAWVIDMGDDDAEASQMTQLEIDPMHGPAGATLTTPDARSRRSTEAGATPIGSINGGSTSDRTRVAHGVEPLVTPLSMDAAPPPPGAVACLRRARFVSNVPSEASAHGGQAYLAAAGRKYGEVDLVVKTGELLLAVGSIASGKSTLLSALAKARPLASGHLAITPRRAYCSQRPFLLRGSVRENILFGSRLEDARYSEAVRLSALDMDLKLLAAGDLSMCGEGGSNLSDGQRARVAFARAIYADADLLVLDDTFAAVDAGTAALLWSTVQVLLRREKTIVLATHAHHLLSSTDVSRIALLKDGQVAECAPPTDLQAQLRGYMAAAAAMQHAKLRSGSDGAGRSSTGGNGNVGKSSAAVETNRGGRASGLSLLACERLVRSTLQRLEGQRVDARLIQRACALLHGRDGGSAGNGEEEPSDADGETRREGLISYNDFRAFLYHFGSPAALFALVFCTVLSAVSSIAANLFLSFWTDADAHSANATRVADLANGGPSASANDRLYLAIYCLLITGTEVLSALQTILLTACSLRASRRMHTQLLARLIRAPLSFFDGTTSGAILNRSLSDLQNIDTVVPDSLLALATKILTFLTQIGLVLSLVPWLALAFPPLIYIYSIIYRRMRLAARDARRVSARMHTPVFAHFADALAGRETIAAYGVMTAFYEANAAHVHAMSRACVAVEAIMKWAQALSVQSGSLLYLCCAISCVLLQAAGRLSTAQLGLVLLYASSLQRAAMELMMQMASVETEFVSVERICEYCRIDDEFDEPSGGPANGSARDDYYTESDGAGALSVGTDADFYTRALMGGEEPIRGALELRGVVMRYAAHWPPSLDGITLSIAPGAKVACVGRTGCGKSTLLRAIARFYPLDSGSIRLDGIDLRGTPLREVRRAVRFVSSEPLFLDGSLLTNLLAFESQERMTRATDAGECGNASTVAEHEAWHALETLGMRAKIAALPLKLQTPVRAMDLSVGERQLLSLCRALVAGRGPRALRLLLCDEPTSCLDSASDHLVHQVLMGLGSTVMVVAHRLHSISQFQQVLVLDRGNVVEQGPPTELAERPGSVLGQLNTAKKSGS